MERREFVRGAALTGLGLTGAGCASSFELPAWSSGGIGENGLLDPEIVKARWAELEQARGRISDGPPLLADGVLPQRRSSGRSVKDDLARKAARALLLTGGFQDLPETARTHPMVQAGMASGMGELDDAVRGMKAHLDGLSPTERADIAREFRSDPELGERVVAVLDDRAASLSISDARRLHLRTMGLQVCRRLHQSSELLIGEYTTKLEKVIERHGTVAEIERKAAAAMGERAWIAMRDRSTAAAEAYRRYEIAGARRISTDGTVGAVDPDAWTTKDTVLTVGGVFMGLAVTCGLIGLIGTVAGGGAFLGIILGGTVGGLFLLTGTILLIVGAVMD